MKLYKLSLVILFAVLTASLVGYSFLGDKVQGMRDQLQSMKTMAAKAEERNKEVTSLHDSADKSREKDERISKLTLENERMAELLHRSAQDYDSLKSDLNRLNQRISELNQKAEEYRGAIAKASSLNKKTVSTRSDYQPLQKNIIQMQREIDGLKNEVNDLQGKINESDVEVREEAKVIKESVPFSTIGRSPALVETQWLADNLNSKTVRIVHIGSMNPQSQQMFNAKHIPGSVYVGIGELMGAMGNGTTPPNKANSEALMSRLGIDDLTHVVIVGSSNNPFTVAGLWLVKYNGHKTASYLNGGVGKWMRENRPMTGNAAAVKPTRFMANPDNSIFASANHVLENLKNSKASIVDVRSAGEYSGKVNPSKMKRTGHIPGAINLDFYPTNLKQDGTFKSIDELKAVYEKNGVTKDKEIIVYCEGGIRASVTHFVLKDILGYPKVRNYVGSWGEWGNRLDPAKYPAEK